MTGPYDHDERDDVAPPLSERLIRGSAWMVAMRWSVRAIGIVSTIILARLLDPQDFGLVAMATVVVGLADTVFSLGVEAALIQNREATREDFDTAWTIQVLQGAIVAALLALAAPLAVRYYGEPRVELVLWILAAGYLVQSAQNIGVVGFQRDLQFARDFRFMVARKVVAFAITVGVALWLRSYWALVAGILAGNLVTTLLSYAMHPYRPRPSLARWSKLWSFSQWMLVRNIGGYAMARGDEFIVGGVAGTRSMGLYSIASEISQMPSSELVAPLDRALFPGFAMIQRQRERLRDAFCRVLQVIALLALPLGLGLAATAPNAVRVVLGTKWVEMIPLVQVLAVAGAIASLRYTPSTVLLAVGGVRAIAFMPWINLAVFVGAALPLAHWYGLIGIAYAKLFIGIVTAPVLFGLLIARTDIRWSDFVRSIWRPAIAGAAMVAFLAWLPDDVLGTPLASLAIEVVAGALVYAALVVLLWFASGRPDGAERWVLAFLRREREPLV